MIITIIQGLKDIIIKAYVIKVTIEENILSRLV